jgi:hypothetical protein
MSEHQFEDPSREIERLEAEYHQLKREQDKCNQAAKELLEREIKGEGFFAAEIYEQKQSSIVLATQMQHLRARINRIKLGLGTL